MYYTRDLTLIVAIYVEDFLIFHTEGDVLQTLKQSLERSFHMKDLGAAKSCIGIRITQGGESISLNQEEYINEILVKFGMDGCTPTRTPVDISSKLSTRHEDEPSLLGKVPYQEALGCLLFFA